MMAEKTVNCKRPFCFIHLQNPKLMKSMYTFAVLVLVCAAFTFSACRKDDEKITKDDIQAAQDNALATNMFDDANKQVENGAKDAQDEIDGKKKAGIRRLPSCAELKVSSTDPQSWPKTITIDFGEENTTCDDLRQRRGKIMVNLSAPYRDSASVHSVNFDGYYVDDNKIEGSKTVTNMGKDEHGRTHFKIEISDATITTPEGEDINWESTRYRYWLEGENTTIWTDGLAGLTDDIYGLTGTQAGTTRTGKDYSISILDTLRVQIGCRWIKQGKLQISISGDDSPITVDYGDGTCDANATATVGDKDYPFVMR